MEGESVIKAVVGQIHEVLDGDGGDVAVQLHGDGAVVLNVDLSMVGADPLCFRLRILLAGWHDGDSRHAGFAAPCKAQDQKNSQTDASYFFH